MNIRDAIHGDISIEEEVIKQLIETKEFQRLRNIKQLGLTYLAFPTTEHSRFMHSVGVYYLVTQLLDVLEAKTGQAFEVKERLALQIACLLHDLGHGPFSHTSEEFFGFNHEDYTIKIIEDKDTEVNKVLTNYGESIIEEVVSFIKKTHHNPVLNTILSGTIDVDRMDYLMRDSFFAGVSYGEIDIQRIFNVIDIKDNSIVFHEKGVKALEDIIISRYNMFSQVYLNKKALAYEVLVAEILGELRTLVDSQFKLPYSIEKVLPFFAGNISVKDYLLADDLVFLTLINDLANLEDNEQTNYVRFLSQAFVNKKIVFTKPDNPIYTNKTGNYVKKVYNESVLIYTTSHDIIKLEDASKLTEFLSGALTIQSPPMEFYIAK